MVGVQVLQFQVQEVAREYSCACETAVVVVAVWVVTGLLTLSAVPAASTGLVMRPLTSKTCMWMLWAVEPIETVTVVKRRTVADVPDFDLAIAVGVGDVSERRLPGLMVVVGDRKRSTRKPRRYADDDKRV